MPTDYPSRPSDTDTLPVSFALTLTLSYPTSGSNASIRSSAVRLHLPLQGHLRVPSPSKGVRVGGRERIRLAGKPRVSPGDGKVGRNGAKRGCTGGEGRGRGLPPRSVDDKRDDGYCHQGPHPPSPETANRTPASM